MKTVSDPYQVLPIWVDGLRISFRGDTPVALLTFATAYPDTDEMVDVARVMTTVDHLRRIHTILGENLTQFEQHLTAPHPKDPSPPKKDPP